MAIHKDSGERLPVAPSMEPTLNNLRYPKTFTAYGKRFIRISILSVILGIAAGFIAQALIRLIGFITNLSFYGKLSFNFISPAGNHLGLWVILIPVIGGIIVGFMARYGSEGIRGHGIPEAMEQVVLNESRIPPRLTFLKPVSAAVAIGTGGPFGAEGPIIATGGALGSLVGQLLDTTAFERKTLLAAGAAAGMAATFGSPISAVLLSVELLLFEFKPQSLMPVTLASVSATALRIFFVGSKPIFSLPGISQPGNLALLSYLVMGLFIGLAAVFVTRSIYKIEDLFEKLPVHWMWWPALGALAVGITGYFFPETMGVGYNNIQDILTATITGKALVTLFVFKFISWSISLGSGTSGGTLAPLFTIGGGLGAVLGSLGIALFPSAGIDVRIAALVGMAGLFTGSARALFASIIFAFETTLQPFGLLPLLAGCSSAYIISGLLMKNTIMTEKIARRGVKIPFEYEADFLDQAYVKNFASYNVISLVAENTVKQAREWLTELSSDNLYNYYPVLDKNGNLAGMITLRNIIGHGISNELTLESLMEKELHVVFRESTLKESLDQMAESGTTVLPVVDKNSPEKIIAILSRSDILKARREYLKRKYHQYKGVRFKKILK